MIKVVSLLLISIVFMACGNRVAFKTQQPLENAALVYVYVVGNINTEESDSSSDYSIRINGKQFLQRIVADEYLAFNLKPGKITMSATRKQIEEKILTLDLKAGQIYYLKVSDNLDGGNFDFELVNNSEGSKEVALTGQAGTSVDSPENIITELITPTKDEKSNAIVKESKMDEAKIDAMIEKKLAKRRLEAPVQRVSTPATSTPATVSSKLEEVQKAYKLKEQGILTDAEFQKLKSEILAR
jgi:hypothetical protein